MALPTINFMGDVGKVDAATAAQVVEYRDRFYVHLFHPSGGYVDAGSFATRYNAETRARELNGAIGAWARLGAS